VKRFGVLLRHYLLISLTLAFITGIILHHFYPVPSLFPLLCAITLLPLMLFVSYWKAGTINVSILLLFVICIGFLHSENVARQQHHKTKIVSQITGEIDSVVIGTLYSMPLYDGKKSTVIIKSTNLQLKDEKHFSQIDGLVQLRLKGIWPISIIPGDTLVIRARLSKPYRFGNPGGFDYPSFLNTKNIHVVGRIDSLTHIHLLQQKHSPLHKIRYLPERIRLVIKQTLDSSLPIEQAAIYRALLIGDRSGLSREQLELFKDSGTFHILAISGLHLSIIASTLFLVLYWLARRSSYLLLRVSCKKLALLATIPPLCCFALLAGLQTPVLRSFVMVVIFILSFCIQRKRSPFTTLSVAALVILLINPKSLFTVSFQLSFAAVASLIVILPRLNTLVQKNIDPDPGFFHRYSFKLLYWIAAVLLVSIAATIGTAPLLIYNFNRFSLAGPIANLLLEPLLCLWSLPIGLIGLPVLALSHTAGEWILHMGGIGITAATTIATFLTSHTFSTLWLPTPSLILILVYYSTLFLSVFYFSRKVSLLLFIPLGIFFFYPPQSFIKSTESELVFLDVGQGSSTLVSFPGRKQVLIDGGGSSSEKFNVGESIIAPYLWSRGIIRLESVVITHPDSDHFNGIPFILKRFKPSTLWINGSDGHDQEYDDLLSLAKDLNIEIKTPLKNQILLVENNAVLETLFNPFLDGEYLREGSRINSNDRSLILKFTSPGKNLSCLFPGDISKRVEREVIESNTPENLRVSLLLAPHHGSKTSNSSLFLERVNPETIIVSAGRFRPLLFPSQALRTVCREKEIPLLNTAEIGAITIGTESSEVQISHFNQVRDVIRKVSGITTLNQ